MDPDRRSPGRRRRSRIVAAVVLLAALVGAGLSWWFRCPADGWPSYDPVARLPDWSAPSDARRRIVVFADTQPKLGEDGLTWHEKAAVMRDRILALDPALLLNAGDLIDAYDARKQGKGDRIPSMWAAFLEFYRPVLDRAPMLPAIGNHDVGCEGFERVFRLPGDSGSRRYWTVELGPMRVVALDSNEVSELQPGGPQALWFERVMAESAAPVTFVLFHHPPFTVGPSDAHEALPIHDLLRPHAARIAAVFTAHDHLYYRTHRDGLPYFVAGGGGWYLSHPREEKVARMLPGDRYGRFHHVLAVDLEGDRVTVRCVQEDGTVFDTVEVWPRDG